MYRDKFYPAGAEQHEVLWLDSSYHGSWDPAAVSAKTAKNVGCIR